ncbi:nuclear transport factor 2 family protein [Streptomyces marincola]|uniref:nuclear transport factor 2 family protein n=1 Tax=Streptomyces marincola TaxID=2878388 RepID=UPI001CF56464|nr:nuclear transport factor 2 family protein [Streptomyces marincola]UCM87594.1 nuclear transport factor 2 family protein [Streptomyces marincola]
MTFPAMPRYVDAWFRASIDADPDAWADTWTEDGIFHDPVGDPPVVGREAIRKFIADALPAFKPFLGLTPVEAYYVADSVAVSWRAAAVTGDGKPVNWAGINIYELAEDGMIKEVRSYFSNAVFQAQANG